MTQFLLSSRLYCRYRNLQLLLTVSPIQPLIKAGRGLYRRLGLSPDPEEFHFFYKNYYNAVMAGFQEQIL